MWRARHRLNAMIAWTLWLIFTALTMIATVGFTSQNIGDVMAARAGVVSDAQAVAEQRSQKIAIAQRAADTATRARAAECSIRGPRCREDEELERQALDKLTQANNLPIEKAPEISAVADPGANMIATLLQRLGVTELYVQYARTGGLTVVPATAGLLLSFSTALLSSSRPQKRREQFEAA